MCWKTLFQETVFSLFFIICFSFLLDHSMHINMLWFLSFQKKILENVLYLYLSSSYQIICVPLVAKLLEKVVHSHCLYFLSSHSFVSPFPSGSHLYHRNKVVLVKVTSDLHLLNPMTLPCGSLSLMLKIFSSLGFWNFMVFWFSF